MSGAVSPATRALPPLCSLRAVLLDMGGVLVDLGEGRGRPVGAANRAGRQALAERLVAAGGRVPVEDGEEPGSWDRTLERLLFEPWREGYRRRYERAAEEPWEPHLARLRAATGAKASDEELLSAWCGPYADAIPALPGAVEALGRLRAQGLLLGLVSNVPLPGFLYRRLLERHRLLAPLAVLRFSYDAGVRKPRPDMLVQALEELSVAPEEAVMVGDRRDADVAAGRAAGVGTVWLTSGRGGADDGPEPDLTLERLAELPAALAEGCQDEGVR